jgi:hypothetical protein
MLISVTKLGGLLGISTADLSRRNGLARSSLGLVTMLEYKHTLRLGERNVTKNEIRKKGGVIDCDKCICVYPNELLAPFVFPFTALTHALVPA